MSETACLVLVRAAVVAVVAVLEDADLEFFDMVEIAQEETELLCIATPKIGTAQNPTTTTSDKEIDAKTMRVLQSPKRRTNSTCCTATVMGKFSPF